MTFLAHRKRAGIADKRVMGQVMGKVIQKALNLSPFYQLNPKHFNYDN